jgi:hypothetical protein
MSAVSMMLFSLQRQYEMKASNPSRQLRPGAQAGCWRLQKPAKSASGKVAGKPYSENVFLKRRLNRFPC